MTEASGRGRRKSTREASTSNKNAAPELKRALYHCNYCQKDISSIARIKCAICPDFDLCLECFSVGAEINPHRNDHDYRVVDNLSFPILHPEWGADEELLLLEAIDMYGMGNWASVSEHVGNKGADQCKQHFMETYILADSFPYPTAVPELANLSQEELRAGVVQARQPDGPGSRKRQRQDTVALQPSWQPRPLPQQPIPQQQLQPKESKGEGSIVKEERPAASAGVDKPQKGQDADQTLPAASGAKRPCHALKEHRAAGAGGTGAGAAGAAPEEHARTSGRTTHHEEGPGAAPPPQPAQSSQADAAADGAKRPGHDATTAPTPTQSSAPAAAPSPAPWAGAKEFVKSKLGFDPDGSGYHFKRHDFDPEWDNDAECTIADMEFTDQDTEEERRLKLRVLEIYNKRLDERERRRSFLLQRNLVRVKHFQMLERRRTAAEREVLARLRVFARFEAAPGEHDELVEGILLEQRLRARVQELKEYRRNGIRTLADAEMFETERRRNKHAEQAAALAAKAVAKSRLSSGLSLTPSAAAAGGAALPLDGLAGGAPEEAAAAASLAASPSTLAGGSTFGRNSVSALQAWRNRRGLPLDITCLPGVELLGRRERELCAMSRLVPVHYLALKDMMMRDCQKHGAVTRQEARTFFRLDPQRCLRLYDLWVSLGWVAASQKGPTATAAPLQLPSPQGPPQPQRPPAPTRGWPTPLNSLLSNPLLFPMGGQMGLGGTPASTLAGPGDWSAGGKASSTPSFGLDLSAFPGATEGFRGFQQQGLSPKSQGLGGTQRLLPK